MRHQRNKKPVRKNIIHWWPHLRNMRFVKEAREREIVKQMQARFLAEESKKGPMSAEQIKIWEEQIELHAMKVKHEQAIAKQMQEQVDAELWNTLNGSIDAESEKQKPLDVKVLRQPKRFASGFFPRRKK